MSFFSKGPNASAAGVALSAAVLTVLSTAASAAESADLQTVTVQGTAMQGYKIDQVDMGPLGPMKMQDVPYSIDVVPSALLQNQLATGVTDALKYLPSTTMADFGGQYSIGRPQSRGFQSSVIQNVRIDGMNAANAALPMEQFQELTVLNGLSGSLYGSANPAGIFNFVQRRPTDTPFLQAMAGFLGRSIGTGFLDGGTTTPGGALRARFTGMYQEGEGYVSGSDFHRELESVALDWRVFDGLGVESNLSHSNWSQASYPAVFTYAQNSAGQAAIVLPEPIDPTREGYGQRFDVSQTETYTGSLRVKYAINEDWRLTVGGLYQKGYGWPLAISNSLTNSAGRYTSSLAPAGNIGKTTVSYLASLNGHVEAFGVAHELMIGANGFQTDFFSPRVRTPINLGAATLANPVVVPNPNVAFNKSSFHSSTPENDTLSIGDTIKLDPRWQLMLTAGKSWIRSTSYGANGAVTSSYKDSGINSAASVIFKPVDPLTTYFTYGDSLQQGDTAPATVVNANENLPPYRSKQYELGVKATAFGLDIKADIFRINRPFANTNPANNVFEVLGEQVDTGFEFMTSGRLGRDLTLFGGFTFINAKLNDTGVVSTEGKRMVGVPRFQLNELVEYDVPVLQGLTLAANFHYTGSRDADNANTQSIDGYSTLDFNVRYAAPFGNQKLTVQAGVNNVTDKRYWASLLPANITGSTSGTYQLSPGAPRQYLASVKYDF
ncbi:MAG: TonB-dependent siderophore receptor [Gammaproteobacteria bacterium]